MFGSPARLVAAARQAGVRDERLLAAMLEVRRDRFVPAEIRDEAYSDRALPLLHRQTTSQPSLVALMVEALELGPDDTVLEVGTGYGYETALLSRLARHVYSVERWAELAEHARDNLAYDDRANVTVVVGDGLLGLPEHAPYDAVVVCAAGREVPDALAEQLVDGGRLVQPVGPGGAEEVTLFTKRAGTLVRVRVLVPALFVPLVEGLPDD